MAYFLVKLIPPRPDFVVSMTAEEARAMREHVDHYLPHLNAGLVIAMGPVADPAGDWGVMIAMTPSRGWLENILAEDPALKIGARHEILPMPALKVAPSEPLAPVDSISP